LETLWVYFETQRHRDTERLFLRSAGSGPHCAP